MHGWVLGRTRHDATSTAYRSAQSHSTCTPSAAATLSDLYSSNQSHATTALASMHLSVDASTAGADPGAVDSGLDPEIDPSVGSAVKSSPAGSDAGEDVAGDARTDSVGSVSGAIAFPPIDRANTDHVPPIALPNSPLPLPVSISEWFSSKHQSRQSAPSSR